MLVLDLFRKQPQELHDYTEQVNDYLRAHYKPPKTSLSDVRFSLDVNITDVTPKKTDEEQKGTSPAHRETGEIKYSLPVDKPSQNKEIRYSAGPIPDVFNHTNVMRLMRSADTLSSKELSRQLDSTLKQSFTDKLIELINDKGMRDSAVYRAAQMDRRLFSKIMSNREFKPAKDTALALVFALQLPLDQANDLLSRAGYTLSHSSKRDVIIEYFIREGIYNLMEVNLVLENLEQKIIGR